VEVSVASARTDDHVFITTLRNAYPALRAALLAERERAERMREALQLLHDKLAEYQRINKIGGYDNHDMRQARAALKG